jgi:iron(III) transport system substrate-binding protein
MKHVLILAFAILSAGTAQAQTPQASWIMPELLAGAKAEGQLTVYSSTNEQEGLPLWKLFEDATGVKVNYVRGAESPLQAKIAIEARTGQHSWDVHNASTVNMVPENLVLQFEPPNAKDVMPEARDPNKRWYGVYAGYSVPQYNTNLVKSDELPKTFEDFLTRKQWVGKLAIEATDRDWMDAILQFYGRDKGLKLLRDIQATLKPVVLDGHFAMARQIAAGEYPISLLNYSMLTTNLKQQGAPTDFLVLDPVHLWFGMVGVNKNAPHPNAAKLAANFLLSREAQEFSAQMGGRVPTRLDVESNPKDLRQRMNEKKVIFLQHSAEQAKASQKAFDEIFKPR